MPNDVIQVYKCLCDKTRLRMLNLLRHGPMCVSALQEALREPQVKLSKHLATMRRAGLVEFRREANRIWYRLPESPGRLLQDNLACLQDVAGSLPELAVDEARWRKARRTARTRHRTKTGRS